MKSPKTKETAAATRRAFALIALVSLQSCNVVFSLSVRSPRTTFGTSPRKCFQTGDVTCTWRTLCAPLRRNKQVMSRKTTKLNLFGMGDDDTLKSAVPNDNLTALENEVVTITNARLDWERVQKGLWGSSGRNDAGNTRNDEILRDAGAILSSSAMMKQMKEGDDDEIILEHPAMTPTKKKALSATTLEVAITAGIVCGISAYILFHNYIICSAVMVTVVFLANGDPMGEEGVIGPLTRVVGRSGLECVYGIQPKLRAISRAVVKGDEDVIQLQQTNKRLEEENSKLTRWIDLRNAVDESLSSYTMIDLKSKARDAKVQVGGTKSQLLMRLAESGLVELNNKQQS
jgi:hypothetical protein